MRLGFFIAAATAAVAHGDQCSAAVLDYTNDMTSPLGGISEELRSSPKDHNEHMCGNLLSATYSCCGRQALEFLHDQFAEADAQLLTAEAEVAGVSEADMREWIASALGDDASEAFVSDLGALEDAVLPVVEELLGSVQVGLGQLSSCARAVMGYEQGMACLACATDDYLSAYLSTEDKEIKVAESTCDKLAMHCAHVVPAVERVVAKAADLVPALLEGLCSGDNPPLNSYACEGIAEGLDGVTEALTSMDVEEELCDGDCRAVICDRVVRGPAIEDPEVRASDLLKNPPFPLDALLSSLDSTTSEWASARRRLSSSSLTNVYVKSDGYEAYEVGCGSGLSDVPCPVEHQGGVGEMAAVAAVCCLVLVVAFVVAQKRASHDIEYHGPVAQHEDEQGIPHYHLPASHEGHAPHL